MPANEQRSWYRLVHGIALSRRVEEVFRHCIRYLVLTSPFSNVIKVPTDVMSIEVDVSFRKLSRRGLEPHLAHHADIDSAHQLLSDNVKAMRCDAER